MMLRDVVRQFLDTNLGTPQSTTLICVAIDDPKAKFEEQYLGEEENSPLGITIVAGKIAFPKAALPLEIFKKVADRFSGPSMEERIRATWHMLVMEVDHLENTKASTDDLAEAMQFILRRDAEQFNDRKRERYVKLFGNAVRSDSRIENVMSLVQTIEQLNEHDIAVLRVLNQVMNKPSDWRPQYHAGRGNVMLAHPTVFIQRAQELSIQIARALGQNTDTTAFSREEGYAICTRLMGFGLAHEIQAQAARELPLTDYCFRLSTEGIKLLNLIGEHVPNFECYFPT